MTQLNLFDTSLATEIAPRSCETSSLVAMAQSLRQAQDELARQRKQTESVHRIGDLAQAVLRRHDLVARRRAAAATQSGGTKTLPVVVIGGDFSVAATVA